MDDTVTSERNSLSYNVQNSIKKVNIIELDIFFYIPACKMTLFVGCFTLQNAIIADYQFALFA